MMSRKKYSMDLSPEEGRTWCPAMAAMRGIPATADMLHYFHEDAQGTEITKEGEARKMDGKKKETRPCPKRVKEARQRGCQQQSERSKRSGSALTSLRSDDTALHFGQCEFCTVAGDDEIAIQHDLDPTTIRGAIHGCNNGLGGDAAPGDTSEPMEGRGDAFGFVL